MAVPIVQFDFIMHFWSLNSVLEKPLAPHITQTEEPTMVREANAKTLVKRIKELK